VTNPGGHSSAPRPDNAIVQLSEVLTRIGAYTFKPELNDVTRAYWTEAAKLEADPKKAKAMRTSPPIPTIPPRSRAARADPATVGRVSTTCVPTMLSGGHARNACRSAPPPTSTAASSPATRARRSWPSWRRWRPCPPPSSAT
jgi:hypothetical protein